LNESIHGFDATDEAMSLVGAALLDEVRRGLRNVGFETIPEDSFGLLAIRVSDPNHVGTAYVELKDGEIRTRIVLVCDSSAAEVSEGSSKKRSRAAKAA
jgi:hypothetical protein